VPLRRPNAEPRTREHLTPSEVESLVEAAKANRHGHRDATMVLLAYRHGLRACELVDLEWSQVDFKAAVMHVRRAKKGTPATHPPRGDELRALRRLQRKSAASSKITPALGPLRRGANLLSTPRYIEQSQGLPRNDNLSVAKPSDDTSALHNLDVVSVDRRFDRPDNICVVFADEDEADNVSPRMELINSIGGHDGGLLILHSGTVSLEPCLCRNLIFPVNCCRGPEIVSTYHPCGPQKPLRGRCRSAACPNRRFTDGWRQGVQPEQLRHRCRPGAPGAPQPEHQRADRGQRVAVEGPEIDRAVCPADCGRPSGFSASTCTSTLFD
jgi:hypothetical protein